MLLCAAQQKTVEIILNDCITNKLIILFIWLLTIKVL